MNKKPKLSIIVPCFNQGHYIREAIESVEKCQINDIYEIIIINDGSTEKETNAILKKIEGEGYKVINQNNQGLPAARNNGIRIAVGDYILPLDSDNRILPEYILESIDILDRNPEIAMVYGDSENFGVKKGRNLVGEFNLQKLMIHNYIDACAVYRKSIWETLGGYDEDMKLGWEDWDFWLRMAINNYKFKYIPKIMFNYRVSTNSMVVALKENKASKSIIIKEYLQNKYKDYLNANFLDYFILQTIKGNKVIYFKFILAICFPSIYKILIKKRIIKNTSIIF